MARKEDSGVGVLIKERCDVGVICLIFNCQMRCMKGDKRNHLKISSCGEAFEECRKDPTGADASSSDKNLRCNRPSKAL